MFASLVLEGYSARRPVSYGVGPLSRRMYSSVGVSFLRRVCSLRHTLPVGQIRIGIAILAPSKVRAPRAVVEVPTPITTLLEEEDG